MRTTAIHFVGIFMAAATVHAADLHVAPNGNDNNSGTTVATALATLQRALRAFRVEAVHALVEADVDKHPARAAAVAGIAGRANPVGIEFSARHLLDLPRLRSAADDAGLRENRLNLLKALRDLFLQVADISYLVVSSK